MAGLNFGNLFGGERGGFPTPLSHQTAKNFSSQLQATLYTVPTGKKFYVTSAAIWVLSNGWAGKGINITAGGTVILQHGTTTGPPAQQTYAVPIQLDEDDTIVTALDGVGNDQVVFTVEGWEE